VPFVGDSNPSVRQLDDRNWRVIDGLTYRGNVDEFVVPAGMHTDFASVPRVVVWFLPRYGRYTRAAILHDYLWCYRVADGEERITRRDADGLFRRVMRELEVPFLRRWIMWAAVRWAALTKRDGRDGWFRDAPQVLLVSIAAAPFVLAAALVVLVSLAALYVVDWIVYLPLRIIRAGKSRVMKEPPRKEVPPPTFDWNAA